MRSNSYHRASHPHRKEMGKKDAKVRLIHNIAGAPSVDVYIDENLVASDVEYRGVSDYLAIKPGKHEITLKQSGTRNELLVRYASVTHGKSYTLLVSGDVDRPETFSILPLLDDTQKPGPGKSKIRFVHDAASSPTVDVYYESYDGNMPLFENYSYKDYTKNYLEVDSNDVVLVVTPAGSLDAVIEPFDTTLEEGKVYSFIASGTTTNNSYPLMVIMTEDKKSCLYM
uniref:DUF4397 domain-containing protein n=1 Tax=Pithovirus LCPAC101 TaxID=2506586 RepID=A0A481Z4Y3_9VIRU|nr:MAG: protein of unknown function DUF4397 [Pithovirus LCPAC101]